MAGRRFLVSPSAIRNALFVGMVALSIASLGIEWRSWGSTLLLPLSAIGFALLHARARAKGQSSFWLGGVYAAWVVFDIAKLALIGLVLADSLVDFRRRWEGEQASRELEPRDGAAGESERRAEDEKQAGESDDDRRGD